MRKIRKSENILRQSNTIKTKVCRPVTGVMSAETSGGRCVLPGDVIGSFHFYEAHVLSDNERNKGRFKRKSQIPGIQANGGRRDPFYLKAYVM